MTFRFISILGVVLISTLAVTTFCSSSNPKSERSDLIIEKVHQLAEGAPTISSEVFDSIVDRIKEDYVEEVTNEKLLEGALNGMLSGLDPHSSYLDSKTYDELRVHTKGEFGGLGMEVTMEDGLVKIVAPMDDTPAYEAGLESGDLIVAIDKKPVSGMTLTEAVDLLRGKPGTKVLLHIKRKNQDVFEKTLTRAIIHVKPVKWELKGNIGYVRIATFNDSTVSLLEEAIKDIKKKLGGKFEGLLLDVRNDPGGLLDAAIGVCNLFLTKGQEIVSTRGRMKDSDSRVFADAKDIVKGIPIVVLINGGSASASEILAGALQDNHRGLVVGTKSFGKGSVQLLMPLTNGGAIKLTTARYYTPSGRSIQAKGIEPDIVIEQIKDATLEKVDEEDRIHEEDFEGALDTKKEADDKQKEADAFDPDKKKKEEVEDYQLLRALDILRAMAITLKFDEELDGLK